MRVYGKKLRIEILISIYIPFTLLFIIIGGIKYIILSIIFAPIFNLASYAYYVQINENMLDVVEPKRPFHYKLERIDMLEENIKIKYIFKGKIKIKDYKFRFYHDKSKYRVHEIEQYYFEKDLRKIFEYINKKHNIPYRIIIEDVLSYNKSADLCKNQEKFKQAEMFYKKALKISNELIGLNHTETALIYDKLANLYYIQKNYDKTENFYKKSLEIREKELGFEHIDTALNYKNLAKLYEEQKKFNLAESYYKKVLNIFKETLDPNHSSIVSSYSNLADFYNKQKKHNEAKIYYTKVLELRKEILGENHPSTILINNKLNDLFNLENNKSK